MTTTARGIAVLQDPKLNKSTAFTEAEKQALGLVGLVPDVTESADLQLQRVNLQLAQKPTDLERYIYLMNLLDHNETLFYRTVMSDPARFLPIVYDPTIGEACLNRKPSATSIRPWPRETPHAVGTAQFAQTPIGTPTSAPLREFR